MRFAITNGEWRVWWRNLIQEEELKKKMADDVCGCSVLEKEEEESTDAHSHKILAYNRPRRAPKTRSTRKMKLLSYTPSSNHLFFFDDQLMMVNIATLRHSYFQFYFFNEYLVILNISKPSKCLQCSLLWGKLKRYLWYFCVSKFYQKINKC